MNVCDRCGLYSYSVSKCGEDGAALCFRCFTREPPRADDLVAPFDAEGSWESPKALGRDAVDHEHGDASSEEFCDRWQRRAAALGLTKRLGEPGPCPLPGHGGHEARLYPTDGKWRLRCGGWTGGLAEVRASIGYGRPRRVTGESDALGRTEIARWNDLLNYEAGISTRGPLERRLRVDLSPDAAAVARGALLLVGLRDGRWDGEPFVLGRRFAAAWCGLTEHTARFAIEELLALGFLEKVGRSGRCNLLRISPESPALIDVLGNAAAVVDALRDALDANEIGAAA